MTSPFSTTFRLPLHPLETVGAGSMRGLGAHMALCQILISFAEQRALANSFSAILCMVYILRIAFNDPNSIMQIESILDQIYSIDSR